MSPVDVADVVGSLGESAVRDIDDLAHRARNDL